MFHSFTISIKPCHLSTLREGSLKRETFPIYFHLYFSEFLCKKIRFSEIFRTTAVYLSGWLREDWTAIPRKLLIPRSFLIFLSLSKCFFKLKCWERTLSRRGNWARIERENEGKNRSRGNPLSECKRVSFDWCNFENCHKFLYNSRILMLKNAKV